MSSFYEDFIENKKDILIPLLQRDYVQGGANDIFDNLLNNLFDVCTNMDTEKKLDLNYIYGYLTDDNSYFVPIDGQQRLITLWLFHLYIFIRKNKFSEKNSSFPQLKFENREYADNFVEELYKNKKNISVNDDSYSDLQNQNWFISTWNIDPSVTNIITAWRSICRKGNKIDFTKIDIASLSRITYDFKELKELGVKDDVYLKMNGRGKPLSYFDNLKSYMDSQFNLFSTDQQLANISDWQFKIDNDWTDLIWNNRQMDSKIQEDISDEFTRLFYTLLLLYWIPISDTEFLKHTSKTLDSHIEDLVRKQKIDYQLLLNELGLKENQSYTEVKDELFERLRNLNKPLSLIWIEKLELFNKDVFIFIYNAIEKLIKISSLINDENMKINLFLDKSNKNNNFYKICLAEANFNTTVPYFYALLRVPKSFLDSSNTNKNFCRYLRLIRNLVVNSSDINLKNLKVILENICVISNRLQYSDSNSFYNSLNDIKFDIVKPFDIEQLKEENNKIAFLVDNWNNRIDENDETTWESLIFEAEQKYFLKGAISFLYTGSDEKGAEKIEWGNFLNKYNTFKELFCDSSNKNNYSCIKSEYRKKVVTIFLKQWNFKLDDYVFTDKASRWIQILTNFKSYGAIVDSLLNNSGLSINDFLDLKLGEHSNYTQPALTESDNSKNPRIYAERKLKKLLDLKDHYFVNFVLKNSKLNNARLSQDKNTIALYHYRASKGLIIFINSSDNNNRDKILFSLYKENKLKFIDSRNKGEENNEISEHFKTEYPDIEPFYYQWEHELYFKINDIEYYWTDTNNIFKKGLSKKFEKIEISDFLKNI